MKVEGIPAQKYFETSVYSNMTKWKLSRWAMQNYAIIKEKECLNSFDMNM